MTEQERIIMKLGAIGILSPADLPRLEIERGRVLALMSDQQWHPSVEIRVKTCGGFEILRRMRELRKIPGIIIEKRPSYTGSHIWEYRLTHA
jgi:hypothetical protein